MSSKVVMREKGSMNELPEEVIGMIGGFLKWYEVRVMFLVSKSVRILFQSNYVWKDKVENCALLENRDEENENWRDEKCFLEQFKILYRLESKLMDEFIDIDLDNFVKRSKFGYWFTVADVEIIEEKLLKLNENNKYKRKKTEVSCMMLGDSELEKVEVGVAGENSKDIILLDSYFTRTLKKPKYINFGFVKADPVFQPIGNDGDEKKREEFDCWTRIDTTSDLKDLLTECLCDCREGAPMDYKDQKYHKMSLEYTIHADQPTIDKIYNMFLNLRTKNSRFYFAGNMLKFRTGKNWYMYGVSRDQAIVLIQEHRVYAFLMYYTRYWG